MFLLVFFLLTLTQPIKLLRPSGPSYLSTVQWYLVNSNIVHLFSHIFSEKGALFQYHCHTVDHLQSNKFHGFVRYACRMMENHYSCSTEFVLPFVPFFFPHLDRCLSFAWCCAESTAWNSLRQGLMRESLKDERKWRKGRSSRTSWLTGRGRQAGLTDRLTMTSL